MPNLIFDAVPMSETGEATGFNTLVRSVGASLGSQVSAAILTGSVVAGTVLPSDDGYTTAFLVSAGIAVVAATNRIDLMEPALSWSDLGDLAADCAVPVLVKGVLTAEDGALAVEHGAAGIVVSNHGGRQLDRCLATADALPEVVDAVEGRAAVLVDGGIRRGVDIAIALALGADAVLVGRPALWGLAAGGEAGARSVLELLREELELTLALCGCASPAELSRVHLRRAPAASVYSG